MKKIFNYSILLITSMLLALTGCKKEELVFDHELPQFETKADAILLEVIMPSGTKAEDVIYMVGDFNPEAKLLLTKAEKSDKKWGVYVTAADFAEGKSLMDGFTFVSENEGEERDVFQKPVVHTLNAAYGSRTNVYVSRWESYWWGGGDFTEDIDHDGHAVFVLDDTGWDEIALYAWGDAEAFGGWPGMVGYTGKQFIKGVRYNYFDLGEANTGLGLHLIFNNNGQGSQIEADELFFTIDHDIFIHLNADLTFELLDDPRAGGAAIPFPETTHDGDAVYVKNTIGWENMRLYMYGTVNNLNGDWPGMEATGTVEFGGDKWFYFDLGAANEGNEEHLIFNNGDGTQIDGSVEPVLTLTAGGTVYYYDLVDLKEVNAVEKPEPIAGEAEEKFPTIAHDGQDIVFVADNLGWEAMALYMWGDVNNLDRDGGESAGWPGLAYDGTVEFKGLTWYYFLMGAANEGKNENLIFNNNGGGAQTGDANVTLGAGDVHYYIATTDADGNLVAVLVEDPMTYEF